MQNQPTQNALAFWQQPLFLSVTCWTLDFLHTPLAGKGAMSLQPLLLTDVIILTTGASEVEACKHLTRGISESRHAKHKHKWQHACKKKEKKFNPWLMFMFRLMPGLLLQDFLGVQNGGSF